MNYFVRSPAGPIKIGTTIRLSQRLTPRGRLVTSHDLARRLFELPDVPTDIESFSIEGHHLKGHSRLISDREFHETNNDDAPVSGRVVAKRIVLHPYPDALWDCENPTM